MGPTFWLILILITLVLFLGSYLFGNFICKKNIFLKNSINKNSIIITTIILIPVAMTVDNEGMAYGVGYASSPFIFSCLTHWGYTYYKSRNKRTKKTVFFNNNFYSGTFGILIMTYIALLWSS